MHSYSKQYMYEYILPSFGVLQYRDYLCNKFRRMLLDLQDSTKLSPVSSRAGKLNMSKLFRHTFDDNIFECSEVVRGNSTTIIFLIDASGSMNGENYIKYAHEAVRVTAFEMCKIVSSAFAKACSQAKVEGIDIEVFMKHDFTSKAQNIEGTYYRGPLLSRVYSSAEKSRVSINSTFDNILRLKMHTPFQDIGGSSRTPELLVLPGLKKWVSRNISSDNVLVVNLTDGGGNSSFGGDRRGRMSELTSAKFNKVYGEWLNLTTVFIGMSMSDRFRASCARMYGENFIQCPTGDIPVNIHRTLKKHISKHVIR